MDIFRHTHTNWAPRVPSTNDCTQVNRYQRQELAPEQNPESPQGQCRMRNQQLDMPCRFPCSSPGIALQAEPRIGVEASVSHCLMSWNVRSPSRRATCHTEARPPLLSDRSLLRRKQMEAESKASSPGSSSAACAQLCQSFPRSRDSSTPHLQVDGKI